MKKEINYYKMKRGYAALAIVGIVASAALYAVQYNGGMMNFLQLNQNDENSSFIQYVSKYGKAYTTKEEFNYRQGIFAEALKKISEKNS